jgi:hypothetical protein
MKGAGGGRPRKPAGQIRHRNKPTKETVRVPAGARVAEVPDPSVTFTKAQRAVWDGLWAQPIATLWDEADVPSLSRLVVLQTSRKAIFDRGLLAEMRQMEDRFLLNPYARAQQRVEIVGEAGDEGPDEEGEASVISHFEDARRRLRGAG